MVGATTASSRAQTASGSPQTIPGARFELVEGARTFSPEDRPERLAELIRDFARAPVRAGERSGQIARR